MNLMPPKRREELPRLGRALLDHFEDEPPLVARQVTVLSDLAHRIREPSSLRGLTNAGRRISR
jgi:hypothetical protein